MGNPIGSTWAMNPVPRIDWGGGGGDIDGGSCRGHGRGENCVNFKPQCEDSWLDTHKIDAGGKADDVEGECSGDWTGGQIVDEVLIPKSIKPGPYVVGWRWDCEETTQVWESCADVVIT